MSTAAPPRARVPTRVRLFVAGTVLCAVLAGAFSTIAAGQVHGTRAVIAAVLLGALILFAHHRPVPLGPRRRIDVGTVPEVCAVLLLPGVWAVAILTGAAALGEPRGRVRPIQRLFNSAVAASRAGLGAAVHQGLQLVGPSAIHDWLAPVLTAAVMYTVTVGLVWGITGVQLRDWPLRRSRLPARELLLADTLLSMTGILAAAAAQAHLWTLLLLPGPALIAQRALRDSIALREQTELAEQARQKAESALAVREAFLSIAAHELRTPLTALKAFQQMAVRRLERGQTADAVLAMLTDSNTQIERLGRLIHELLDAAQLMTGHLPLQLEPTPLVPLVERVIGVARAVDTGREVNLVHQGERPTVLADSGRLEQVLFNLIENARKYSREHAPITVRIGTVGEQVTVAVEDQGIGIDPADQERILARFERGANVDPGISGLGLGLHIANEIVRAHNGSLNVQSTLGTGSVFTICLPRMSLDDAVLHGGAGS